MMKVRILDRCEFCDGEAYIFVCEDVDSRGETYDRYRPCEVCQGSGNREKWVTKLSPASRSHPHGAIQACLFGGGLF